MAIKGLTDRKSVTPRLTRLGKVKKGERNGKQLIDLEYLRFVGEGPDKEELERVWFEAYGGQPVRIELLLPLPTMEENWKTWMEKWSGKQGLQHRCNGENLVQWLDHSTMRHVLDYELKQKKPCPYGAIWPECKEGCKEIGRLTMILPPFLAAGYAGYIVLETHSQHDLHNITSSLLDVEAKAKAARRPIGLQGIEFLLTRRLDTIGTRYTNKQGDLVKTTADKWMLHLDPTREWLQAQIGTVSQLALGSTPRIIEVEAREALPAPEPEPEGSILESVGLPQDPGEGPQTEPEPATPVPAEPRPRPTTAEEIKGRLLASSAAFVAKEQARLDKIKSDADPNPIEPDQTRRGIFAGMLGKCFAGNAATKRAQRVLVTWWLFNTDDGSSATMTSADISAWGKEYIAASTTEEKYPLRPYAISEMAMCHAAALKAAGQMELEQAPPAPEAPPELWLDEEG